MGISEIDYLFQMYSGITSKEAFNRENVKLYHNWYDNARVLFDIYFSEQDKEMQNFCSVNNERNGYGLYDNFSKIRSSYAVLSNRVRNMMKDNKPKSDMSNKVFVVHGHDDSMKNDVKSFLLEAGLLPVILHEQVNSGRTIIQKLLEEIDSVAYAVILYSPCDEGRRHGSSDDVSLRARQNVVFEHGLLVGLLGINKVCCLHCEGVELPSDLSGVLFIPYDKEVWRYKLAKEMKAQGLDVDLNKIKL